MADSPGVPGMNEALESFLAASDGAAAEERLGDLLARHAAPIVRRVVGRRLGSSLGDIEDVCSQVMLQLMLRLRQERAGANLADIDAFASYVATAAHHGCDHVIRARYPLRWRLRNRIRYVLEHDAQFAIWKAADGSWMCGLAEWRLQPATGAPRPSESLTAIPKQHVRELLSHLFQPGGSPLELSAVVDEAASAWGVPLHQYDDAANIEGVPDLEPRADVMLEQRARLERVWTQIRELPLRQRHAVLLNLREDAITLFLTIGAASLREIAASLELPVEHFAALWNDLPLPDSVVAVRLGCTRQQVINLRMAARKRLAHRLVDAS
jgi:DNA-directed RNA polymerase specialized sigma24 family protein